MPGAMWAYLFYGIFFGIPLATVGIVVGVVTTRQIATLATSPNSVVGAIHGLVRRTPTGAAVVGWSGIVRSTTRRGKSSTSKVLCTLGQLEGLAIGGRPLSLPAEKTQIDDVLELLSGFRGQPRKGVVYGDIETTEVMPAEVLARCALPPLEANEKRAWTEHRFFAGEIVTFVGCREGEAIAACRENVPGNGALLVGDRRRNVGRLLAATMGMTAAVVGISLFFAAVAAVTTITHLRRHLRGSPA
jgi:hypothetical protein